MKNIILSKKISQLSNSSEVKVLSTQEQHKIQGGTEPRRHVAKAIRR